MAKLSFIEKHRLEKLLEMGAGYVLNFNNRTFREFVLDSAQRDISDSKYEHGSGSKANRLRAFWAGEPNHIVGKLLNDLLDYCKWREADSRELYGECRNIAQRLVQDVAVQDIEAIEPNAEGKDFEVLAKSVRDSIDKNEPESGLDRLHTFVVKYIRVLCKKSGIETDRDKPLHSIFGEYIKHLRMSGNIESAMTERILKSSISIFESFNEVRNERSLAHDNPVLSYSESLLIFNNVVSSIRFIAALNDSSAQTATRQKTDDSADLPF